MPWHRLGAGLGLFPRFQVKKKKSFLFTGLHTLGVLRHFLEHRLFLENVIYGKILMQFDITTVVGSELKT